MHFLRRVSVYLLRYRWMFFLTVGLAVGSLLFLLAVPQVVRWVFANIIQAGRADALGYGVLLVAACFFFREVLNSFRIRVNNTLEQKVLIDLRRDLHAKLLDLPVAFYDRRKSGEVASRVTEDVQQLESALLDGTEQGTVAVLTLFGITVILFTMNPVLAALVLAPLPVLVALGVNHSKATRKNWRRVREAAGEMNSLVVEDIQANRLIHAFGLRDRERRRFLERAEELRRRTLKAMLRWSIYNPVANFTVSLGTVAVVGLGGYFLMDGSIQFEDFLAFYMYCAMLYEPLARLHGLNHMFAAAKAAGERVFEILDQPVEVDEPGRPRPFPAGLPEVRYGGVDFSYPGRDEVIRGVDLVLPAGQVTALVGHTGAGKSTLANLLLRYYDVTGGAVTVNGVDVRELGLAELRTRFGYVAQDPFLFDGSVRENLLLAVEEAAEEDLVAALEGARAWGFVSRLPDGLDTLIGERGIRLSMGEKQRLTIARVLLKNPPLIILDEATASVDTITECYIQEALETLMERRTVLIIAHRLSTVRRADQIVVLDHGRIVERGTHADLLGGGGHYAKLWNTQHDFIPESSYS